MSSIHCLHFFVKISKNLLEIGNWLMVGIWKQCSPFAAKLIGLKQQLLSWPGIAVLSYKLFHLLLMFCFMIFILFNIFTSCFRLLHLFLPTYLFNFGIAWFVENTFFLFFYQLVLSSPPRLVGNKFLFPCQFSNILLHEKCSCNSEI